jgi:hypothetical protein
VKGVARLDPGEGLEFIPVQNRNVMVASFDHDKKVERIARIGRLRRPRGGHKNETLGDLFLAPRRSLWERGVNETRHGVYSGRPNDIAKGWHLSALAALGDRFRGFVLA